MNNDILNLIKDTAARKELSRQNHKYFFSIYFGHYMKYQMADFHDRMFELTNDEGIKFALVMAFRGSAKSTIITMSYPIWAIAGILQKKFVVIVSQTQRQARQHFVNIQRELESNELLRADLGPFKEISDEWGSLSLVIPKYNARITAVSMEQTIRGMRHLQYRPDLVICDDIEDIAIVKTQEGRDKIYNWITGEVIPAGDPETKFVFVGNLLHEDSAMVRLRDNIVKKDDRGGYLEVPLLDHDNQIAWRGKYPNMDAIEAQKRKTGNEISWSREYLLVILPDADQVIKPHWVKYYDSLPRAEDMKLMVVATGIDLAISQKETADYTAMVSVAVFDSKPCPEFYVLPNIVNKKMTFNEIIKKTEELHNSLKDKFSISEILVEQVAFQEAAIQELNRNKVPAKGVTVALDKHARLSSVSHVFEEGKIFFPKQSANLLIRQLLGFGSEKHDDLVDALTLCLDYALKTRCNKIGIATADFYQAFIVNENYKENIEAYEKDRKIDYYKRLQKLNDKGFFL